MSIDNLFAEQVKALYMACLDVPDSLRVLHIQHSNYDAAVKSRVLRLIDTKDNLDDVLSKAILTEAQQTISRSLIKSGDVIEQYRLDKKIGEGGQGEVWLAHRNDGEFDHQVAIKLIKLSPNKHELRRFQIERVLLASLKHPNITALLGGGRYQDRLFMVMEWVDGNRFFDHVMNNDLGLIGTLKCFLQVCEAVSYAQSKGVIHRDIKPSNVLVTSDGLVKLLDFGIAKTTDMESTLTQSEMMMSLAYSSPEQIEGKSVTTATDVYALGLFLYELLTTQQAQQKDTDSTVEYLTSIAEKALQKPSEVINKNSRFDANLLKGDLDNLIMMCLRKEPARWYRNADDLIDDLKKYLAAKPLKASGESIVYKMGKLFQRNPLVSGLSVLVIVFLIVLPLVMFQHSNELTLERDKARESLLVANKTTEFLTTLFESVSPLGAKGQQVDLQSVLLQGERQLENGMTKEPRVLAALLMNMAAIHYHIENKAKAIENYQRAAQLYHDLKDHEGELAGLGQLALMYFRIDDLENTEKYFKQADHIVEKVNNMKAESWHLLRKATVANERGQQNLAINFAEKAMQHLKEMPSDEQDDAALLGRIYSELGESYKHTDMKKSLKYNELSLIYAEQQVGKIHPFYLNRLSSRAIRLMRLNRHDEAQKMIDETIEISSLLYSDDHPRHASFLTSKATYLHDKGFYKETEKLYMKMLSIHKKHYGVKHFENARVINNLAYLYEDHGYYEKALPLYIQSVQLRKDLDAKNLIRIATAESNLARLYAKLHQHEKSKQLIEQVIPVFLLNNRSNIYNNTWLCMKLLFHIVFAVFIQA